MFFFVKDYNGKVLYKKQNYICFRLENISVEIHVNEMHCSYM